MRCKTSRGDFFYLSRVSFPSLLNGPQADLFFFFFFFFLFSCRMARGYEEVSNSQVGCQRGTPWETPTASSLVVVVSAKELRLNNQVPTEIGLEMSDGPTASTVGEIMPPTSPKSSPLLGFASLSHRW